MRITNMNILTKNDGRLYSTRALFDVVLEDYILIKGFKLQEGDNGIHYILPPSKTKQDGTYVDVVTFLLPEVKKDLENMAIHLFMQASR